MKQIRTRDPKSACVQHNPGLLQTFGQQSAVPDWYPELQHAWENYDEGPFGWQAFLESKGAVWHMKKAKYNGHAVLFVGSPSQHLPAFLKSAAVLRSVHMCDWQFEFWTEAGECMH